MEPKEDSAGEFAGAVVIAFLKVAASALIVGILIEFLLTI